MTRRRQPGGEGTKPSPSPTPLTTTAPGVADGRCRVSDIFGYQRSAPFGSIEIWHLNVSTLGLKVVRGSIEYCHLLSRETERHFEPIRRREGHNDGLRIGSKFDAYVLSRIDQTKGLVMVFSI